jgi:hypothetical protein
VKISAIVVKTCAIDAKTFGMLSEMVAFRTDAKTSGTAVKVFAIVERMFAIAWKTAWIETRDLPQESATCFLAGRVLATQSPVSKRKGSFLAPSTLQRISVFRSINSRLE